MEVHIFMKKLRLTDEIITNMSQLLFIAADETRLKILLALLANKNMCVGDLQNEINASQSLVSHQLQVLKKNKLVAFKRTGNKIFYSLDDNHIHELIKVAYDHVNEERENEND